MRVEHLDHKLVEWRRRAKRSLDHRQEPLPVAVVPAKGLGRIKVRKDQHEINVVAEKLDCEELACELSKWFAQDLMFRGSYGSVSNTNEVVDNMLEGKSV